MRGGISLSESDVHLAKKGDKDAFTRIITNNEGLLYRISKNILKNDIDCADAIQETILKCYASIELLKKPVYFRTWLVKILLNECYNILRYKKRVLPTKELYNEPATDRIDKDYHDLKSHIDNLDADHQNIIILFYYEEFSIKEIAEILDIKEGTVKSRLARARNKLALLLNENKERGIKIE
jgi:RNA polymerase sigma-70 factor, ECF subfamily